MMKCFLKKQQQQKKKQKKKKKKTEYFIGITLIKLRRIFKYDKYLMPSAIFSPEVTHLLFLIMFLCSIVQNVTMPLLT